MIVLLGPLVIIGLIVTVVVSITKRAQRTHADQIPPAGVSQSPSLSNAHETAHARSDVSPTLERWVAAQLLTEEQAAAISEFEHRQSAVALVVATEPSVIEPPPRRRVPVVAESLGYLGGVLAAVGLVLATTRFWRDLATSGRLGLSGGAALVLLVAGAFVREHQDAALARLRGFLWLVSTAAAALFAGAAAVGPFGADSPKTVVAACSGAVAVYAGLLWFGEQRPLQQSSSLIGAVTLAGALTSEFTAGGPPGLAVWIIGAVFFVLGLRCVTAHSLLTEGVGAVAMIVGAEMVANRWTGFGLLLAVVTGGGLIAIAALPGAAPAKSDRLLTVIVGGLAVLQTTPATLTHFSHEAGGVTGLTTWLVGAFLIAVGWRRRIHLPILAEVFGGLALIGGAALTWRQWHGAAPLFGIATGVALIAVGMLPQKVLMSAFGSLALLVNLPWAIGWFFPGQGRAPRLILVTGVLIIIVAVLMTRMSGRFRRELGQHAGPSPLSPGATRS